VLYLVGALSLIGALRDPAASRGLWWIAVPALLLGLVYGALLLRGPFDPLERAAR
jgi:hypothetical protein